ncbi:MAG: LysE family transporter [Candidatus Hodarchaeales archaeon]|jgi:threonine/homoserine/homoserine lactone efflux protein
MSPGPLLTYTVYKSIQAKRKAYLVGIFVCIGHAILEFAIILFLLIGMGPFISDPMIIITIGLGGGIILIFFGSRLLFDIKSNKIDFSFLHSKNESDFSNQSEEMITETKRLTRHPIIGGVLVSMSNPYWWLWWAVIGLNFMTQFSVSLSNQLELLAFFFGHELGDFLWYGSIATALGFTQRFITKRIYIGILIACSIFMIGFGLYLAISPILAQ